MAIEYKIGDPHGRNWVPYAVVGVLALIGFIAIGAYNAKGRLEAAEAKPLSIAAITAKPNDYIGQMAKLQGRVVRVINPHYFTMTDTGGELLINCPKRNPDVPARENHPTLISGDMVQAIGKIKRFELPEGTRGIDQYWASMRGHPVLEADSASVTTAAILPPNFRSVPPSRAHAPARPSIILSDLDAIFSATDRKSFRGRRVHIRNVTVERVISDRGFWVQFATGKRLFCRLARGLDDGQMEYLVQVKKNQIASLTGSLADPPRAAFMDRNWDLDSAEAQEVAAFSLYLKVDAVILTTPSR